MLIHQGEKYTIHAERGADGTLRALKRGVDGSCREEKFYPERDCSAMAGDTDEYTAWEIIRDIAAQLDEGCLVPVEPSHIMIAGSGSFELCEWSHSHDPRFTAPEGYEPIWALGASIFYLVLGCPVFQGGGGAYQHATTPVPMMRRNASELSALVGKCLCFKPSDRPSVKEIKAAAEEALKRLDSVPPARALKHKQPGLRNAVDSLDSLWPEKMV
ncbi:MAG: hypothetical protein K2L96_05145 [Muribaculaceae bacterium]|nr:hypothetical protein [Muribaculaceae bacterium]